VKLVVKQHVNVIGPMSRNFRGHDNEEKTHDCQEGEAYEAEN